MKCLLVSECAFFNDKLKDMPAMSEVLKERFCMGDNRACARYIVYLKVGKSRVPQNLFPNSIDMVESILKELEAQE
ncbi:hypothetical protein ACFLZI_03570 [Nitrospirota bacterium]